MIKNSLSPHHQPQPEILEVAYIYADRMEERKEGRIHKMTAAGEGDLYVQ